MQKVVALVQRQIAAFFFQRAEAGEIELQLACIRGQQPGDKTRHFEREMLHHALQPLAIRRVRGDAFQNVFGRAVRDVLMKTRACLLL